MSTLKSKIVASAVIASLAAGIAAPASAASYYGTSARELREDIAQLDRRVDRLQDRHVLTWREAARYQSKVEKLEDTWRYFARGGFTRGEINALDRQIDAVSFQLQQEVREGRGGYDRDNRYESRDSHYDNRDDRRSGDRYDSRDDDDDNGRPQQDRNYRQR